MDSTSQLPISPPTITGCASLVKEWNTSAGDGILTFARVQPAPFQLLTEDRFPRRPITIERGHLAGKLARTCQAPENSSLLPKLIQAAICAMSRHRSSL